MRVCTSLFDLTVQVLQFCVQTFVRFYTILFYCLLCISPRKKVQLCFGAVTNK